MSLKLNILFFLALGAVQVNAVGKDPKEWWKDTFIYQIYPRSFKDSDGDGIGDLNGITSKLEHLADLNVSALAISPIYTSPMVDFGYDIANFTEIDPVYGTLSDFTNLTTKAKSIGLKVVIDFVPNHSSDQHPWFKKSIQQIKPYDEYYIWVDAKLVNGTRKAPNNWLCSFGGSAWEWNTERGQYYLHQFAIGQPDLNYRSAALNLEMQNVLTFWLDHGVDGFRIDALNVLFEDSLLLDEPVITDAGLPPTDYETLNHIYTKDLNDTYLILKTWRKVVDSHAKAKGETKIILTEALTTIPLAMKYFEYGSNVPINFMFVNELNNKSRPIDFKGVIDDFLNAVPKGRSANWIVGNHDQPRAATRYGPKRADHLSMLSAVLPGVGVINNGDEIGMENLFLTYNQTLDPAGCSAGPSRYNLKSRDPERTPFQWDATVSAGFSTNNKTWLPVHPNYKTLNLAAQKSTPVSHYSVFKKLVALKKEPMMDNASTEVILVTDNVLSIVRRATDGHVVALLINFSESMVVVNAHIWMNIPDHLFVYVSSTHSNIPSGVIMDTSVLNLPGAAAVILSTKDLVLKALKK